MRTETNVVLRVAVDHAPTGPGDSFGLQDRSGQVVGGSPGPHGRLTFAVQVRVATRGGTLNFLGPFTHGRPTNRHLYLSHGMAGVEGWVKRIKLPLASITREMVTAASDGAIETVVDGRSAATVRTEWRVER